MDKYITRITGKIPNSKKEVSINDIDGKTIIFTGINGCGKTLFLRELSKNLSSLSEKRRIQRYIQISNDILKSEQEISSQHGSLRSGIANHRVSSLYQQKEQLIVQDSTLKIDFNSYETVVNKASENLFVHTFFDATRQYRSVHKNRDQSLSTYSDFIRYGKSTPLSIDVSERFEGYLVSFIESCYIAYAMRSEIESKEKADAWMLSVESDLQHLFEDSSLKFSYEEKSKRFFISQNGKEPFDLSVLSSGYSAILKIYSELILKVEFKSITPQELSGIVFIDEIDAHLHVSLQKKILPFLTKAYPNLQFIVSTHSPFVLQSVDNAIVYDLTNNEQMEDLSLYSYESILKGLLGVETKSNELILLVDNLAELIPKLENKILEHKDDALRIISKLREVEAKLDSKSKVVLLMAEQALDDLGE